jgi:hypothetical protein
MIKKIALISFFVLIFTHLKSEETFVKVIKEGRNYKFEIPDSILGRDILFGSRIVDISSPNAKVYAAGQMRRPPVLVRFSRKNRTLLIEEVSNFVDTKAGDPINDVLERNMKIGGVNLFDIESRNSNNDASVVDVTKYFSEEVQLAWPLPDNVKKGRLEPKLSGIQFIKEFENRVNIRSYYEFLGGKETFTITVQYFLLLLPKEPLMTRYNDDRVGYQPFNKKSFSSGNPIATNRYISRWRIEPSPQDIEKHQKGEIVNPSKPIVIYIEPYFPKSWIPYIKQGIEDWNLAFEKIGFKDVLVAKEFPDDPSFDPYDITINAVRYIPLDEANAAGQIWTDPRSGEIINGEVLWWNNVVNLINMWRFTQTSAVDPSARALSYSDKIMGEMVRYAIAHEVGHVLGLQHNMRSSYAYPTDSLRSPTFTAVYGTTASIMDYARNNHIARPGDLEKGVKLTPPILGPYDYLSIEYGYKHLHGITKPDDELPDLNLIFTSKGDDPMYQFAPFIASPISPDPAAQAESLGNDIIVSSANGILNTRIILDSLIIWTTKAGGGAREIESRYDALSKQYFRYITLTMSYIGGTYVTQGPLFVNPVKFKNVSKSKQKEAVQFVLKHLREAPHHLDRKDLTPIMGSQTDAVMKRQGEVLTALLNNFILPRVVTSSYPLNEEYNINEYLSDIDSHMWKIDGKLSIYDRNLHIVYIQTLRSISVIQKRGDEAVTGIPVIVSEAAFRQLQKTRKILEKKRKAISERGHYDFLLSLITNG